MNILFISNELIGSAVCHKLIKEGHDVKLYIHAAGWKSCLDGIVPKVTNWQAELDWVGKDGLIIFDDVVFGEEYDELLEQGYRVVGTSSQAAKLETDREFFQTILSEYGCKTLPAFDFNTGSEAVTYIQGNPDYWVAKRPGHFGALNCVGEASDGSDVISVINNYIDKEAPVHLQKRATGVEVGVARYFNGDHWIGPIEINHEHKRMCNDDIGPFTPEMGTVMWMSEDETLPLYQQTLAKIEPLLRKLKFKGDIDINYIIDGKDVWPLEATVRFGTPSTELQTELLNVSWVDFLSAIADGEHVEVPHKEGYGIVVSVAIPPFPFTNKTVDESIFGSELVQIMFQNDFTDSDREHVHFEEVSRMTNTDGTDTLYWSGTNGWILHVSGHGDSIEEARDNVYNIIKKIILPQKFYRTDIGNRVAEKDLPLLRDWGWI